MRWMCLPPAHLRRSIRFVTYQLLKALKYVHSARLLHRDVKPSNVLVDAGCAIKLCDFGLCRSLASEGGATAAAGGPEDPAPLTDYVATRWYRGPEILVGSRRYTEGIDLWSVGCILGEMFRGRPVSGVRSCAGGRRASRVACRVRPSPSAWCVRCHTRLVFAPVFAFAVASR